MIGNSKSQHQDYNIVIIVTAFHSYLSIAEIHERQLLRKHIYICQNTLKVQVHKV